MLHRLMILLIVSGLLTAACVPGDPDSGTGMQRHNGMIALTYLSCPKEVVRSVTLRDSSGNVVWQLRMGDSVSASTFTFGLAPKGYKSVVPLTENLGSRDLQVGVETNMRSSGDLNFRVDALRASSAYSDRGLESVAKFQRSRSCS